MKTNRLPEIIFEVTHRQWHNLTRHIISLSITVVCM